MFNGELGCARHMAGPLPTYALSVLWFLNRPLARTSQGAISKIGVTASYLGLWHTYFGESIMQVILTTQVVYRSSLALGCISHKLCLPCHMLTDVNQTTFLSSGLLLLICKMGTMTAAASWGFWKDYTTYYVVRIGLYRAHKKYGKCHVSVCSCRYWLYDYYWRNSFQIQ